MNTVIKSSNNLCFNLHMQLLHASISHIGMLCTAQLGGPVPKAFGRVQNTPFQLGGKSPKITDQHAAGGSVSQLSQLAKLSPWLTLSTKYITTSFWHYNKWFWFLSNQIMGLYHSSNPKKIKFVHLRWKINVDYLRSRMKERSPNGCIECEKTNCWTEACCGRFGTHV